jgi:cytochrome b subunit of formate dehydrogenase
MKDWRDFVGHMKWFFNKGPKPQFDRWTYWEKFDYLAVFWGVAMIGVSGLVRWQEEFFGNLLGGGAVSLATTIHQEEALLATAFIFIVHFFNTHMRSEKFPMDVCIYTGLISEEEMIEERPEQYERLKKSGILDKYEVKVRSQTSVLLSYLWGTLALSTGLFLLVLIVIGLINH